MIVIRRGPGLQPENPASRWTWTFNGFRVTVWAHVVWPTASQCRPAGPGRRPGATLAAAVTVCRIKSVTRAEQAQGGDVALAAAAVAASWGESIWLLSSSACRMDSEFRIRIMSVMETQSLSYIHFIPLDESFVDSIPQASLSYHSIMIYLVAHHHDSNLNHCCILEPETKAESDPISKWCVSLLLFSGQCHWYCALPPGAMMPKLIS